MFKKDIYVPLSHSYRSTVKVWKTALKGKRLICSSGIFFWGGCQSVLCVLATIFLPYHVNKWRHWHAHCVVCGVRMYWISTSQLWKIHAPFSCYPHSQLCKQMCFGFHFYGSSSTKYWIIFNTQRSGKGNLAWGGWVKNRDNTMTTNHPKCLHW